MVQIRLGLLCLCRCTSCRAAVARCREAWQTIAGKRPQENGIDSPQRLLSDWSRFASGEAAAAGVHVKVAQQKVAERLTGPLQRATTRRPCRGQHASIASPTSILPFEAIHERVRAACRSRSS